MSMSINPAGQSWQQPPVPRHDDLPQKLMQERSDYRVEISSLPSSKNLTSAIPELETHSHL